MLFDPSFHAGVVLGRLIVLAAKRRRLVAVGDPKEPTEKWPNRSEPRRGEGRRALLNLTFFTFSFAASRLYRFFAVFRGFPSVTHGYAPTPLRG
jgi:hypothetical protein